MYRCMVIRERHEVEDKLGIEETVQIIKRVIELCEPPLSIGVIGDWGQGKTTLMRHVANRLDQQTCVTAWFDAWKFDLEVPLLLPLLQVMNQHLFDASSANNIDESKNKAREIGWETAKALAALVDRGAVVDSFKRIIELGASSNVGDEPQVPTTFVSQVLNAQSKLSEYSKLVLESLRPGIANARLVVFVDDLDRCSPDRALELLDHCRLYFEANNIIFVYGLNPKAIDHAVVRKYGGAMSGASYLQKLVPIEFEVRHAQSFRSLLVEEGLNLVGTEQSTYVKQLADFVTQAFCLLSLKENPRIGKRIFLRLLLAHKGHWNELDVILEVLKEHYPKSWHYFADKRTVVTFRSRGNSDATGAKSRYELGVRLELMEACQLSSEALDKIIALHTQR